MAISQQSPVYRLASAAYMLSALLVLIPIIDTAVGVFPPQARTMYWRYGASGVFSRGLLEPSLGCLVAALIAVSCEHRVMRRVLSVVFGVIGIALLFIALAFVFDATQMRKAVRPELQANFTATTILAALRYVAIAAVALVASLNVRNRKPTSRTRSASRSSVRSDSDGGEYVVVEAPVR